MPRNTFFFNCFILIAITIPSLIGSMVFIEQQYTRSLYANLEDKVSLIAATLRGSEFSVLNGTEQDLTTTSYQSIKSQFVRIGNYVKQDGVRWIYAIRKSPAGIIFLVDSADPSDPGYSAPGTIYTSPPPVLQNSDTHPTSFVTGPYTDEYGTYISAFAPLYVSDGTVTTMIAADIEYSSVQRVIQKRRITIFFVGIGLIGLLLILYYFVFSILEARRVTVLQQKEITASRGRIQEIITQLEKEKQSTEAKNMELERTNRLMVNRELNMIELKTQIHHMTSELAEMKKTKENTP